MILLYFILATCPTVVASSGLLRGGPAAADVVGGDRGISTTHHHHGGGQHRGGHRRSPPSHDDRDKRHSDDDESGDFDFYVYSMTHQPDFCRENGEKYEGCHEYMESWEGQLTIHGLWPNRNDGTYPSSCTTESLDPALLTDLSDDLSSKWPNVKSMSGSGHASFWDHEWSKHGTCSGLDQRSYFASALGLLLPTPSVVREKYGSVVSRGELISGYGIVASFNVDVDVDAGVGTPSGGGGVGSSTGGGDDHGNDRAAVLVCKHGYLSEVRVCYAKGAGGSPSGRMPCPDAILKEDNCGDEIEIASFDGTPTEEISAIE